jgi:glycosyltransferase involved in cell wall biosynthesis
MSRPRIFICTDGLPGVTYGGRDQRLLNVLPLLAGEAEFHLLTLDRGESPLAACNGAVTVHAVARAWIRDQQRKRSWVNGLVLNVACAWWLLWHKADLVELDQVPCAPLPLALLSCWLTRKPILVHWLEGWYRNEWMAFLGTILGTLAYLGEKFAFTLAPAVANSQFTADRLREIHRKPQKKVFVAPPGFARPAAGHPGAQRYHLGFVGRLVGHKRVDLFLELVQQLKAAIPDVRAVIIGDGEQYQTARELAGKLGLAENVEFKGRIQSHEEVLEIISSLELLVITSEREGFGLTLLEANAAGVPVLVRKAPASGAVCLIEEGVNGFVRDTEDLGEGAQSYLLDRVARARMSRGAQAVAARFSAEYAAESLERAYRSVGGEAPDSSQEEVLPGQQVA